jgi:ankyrin repeat protein
LLEARNAAGETALALAAERGAASCLDTLVKAGARVDTHDDKGRSALSRAIRTGHVPAAGVLIAAGAPVNGREGDGLTPLMQAVLSDSPAMVELLLTARADPDQREAGTGNTALMLAANRGQREAVVLLLEHGADASLIAEDGWTAAQAARMVGEEALARLLEAAARR